MLEYHFFCRLLLVIVFGVVYIFTMLKMANSNSVETVPQKHVVFKFFGSINVLLAILSFIMGVFWMMQVQYPEQTIDFSYNANQIVRTSDKSVIWGYPTSEQNRSIMGITNLFSNLALAAYFFFYKKSGRTSWKKFGRFIFGLLMYSFYCSATNLHYFDVYEIVAPVGFCLMVGYVLMKARKSNEKKMQLDKQYSNEPIHEVMDETSSSYAITSEVSKSIHQSYDLETDISHSKGNDQSIDISVQANVSHTMQLNDAIPSNNKIEIVNYCRNCGKKVDYSSSIYCKYCGKKL